MEFAFRIDRHVKANLYKICRLCGIENQDMMKILRTSPSEKEYEEDPEPELSAKIFICLGIEVRKFKKYCMNKTIYSSTSGFSKRQNAPVLLFAV